MAICTALAFQIPAPTGTDRETDVYRIYSLLLSHPGARHGQDNNPRYLIAATTRLGSSEPPCVRPPQEREEEFKEVLADFTNRKAMPELGSAGFLSPSPMNS